MNTYAVEQFTPETITTRNGHCRVVPGGWREVMNLEASGRNSALQQADQKWPDFKGKHRARLIQTALHPAPLCADDRAFIHSMTHQAI